MHFHTNQLLELCQESINLILMGNLSLDGIQIKHKYFFRIRVNMLRPTWGCELWDGYDSSLCHLTSRADLMVDVYARFFKEKADLEKDYAKGLRKLIAKYEPVKKKKKNEDIKESTELSSFR